MFSILRFPFQSLFTNECFMTRKTLAVGQCGYSISKEDDHGWFSRWDCVCTPTLALSF